MALAATEVYHFGVRIPIDRGIMSPRIVEALQSGQYEHKEARELERIIGPGERVLEIGGGLGFISSLVAANPNTEATRVFEANPRLAAFICNVHALNGIENVGVEAAILSNSTTSLTQPFYVREDFWSSSLSPAPFGFKEVIDVSVRSFNAEIKSFAPTLIICDIEGGELELFANADLTGVAKVYIEVHQKVLGRMGIKRLFDAFSARNFHYDQYHSEKGVVLFSRVDRK